MTQTLSGVLRPKPLSRDTIPFVSESGKTIEQILRSIPDLPPEIWTNGIVRIGTVELSREHWSRIRPKPGSLHFIEVGIRLHGGGGSSGKSIFGLIATIALLVVVTAISGGALGPAGLAIAGDLFAAGSVSATLLAAGVATLGGLALSALSSTPAAQNTTDDNTSSDRLGAASFRSNVLGLFDPIPFVAGKHRVSPPHVVQPWVEYINDDAYVNAVVGLNGPHMLEEILVNGAPIDDFQDITYETRDVVTDDTDLTLIAKQVFEQSINAELSSHKVSDEATDQLQDQGTPSNSYPTWLSMRSRNSPNEIWIAVSWTGLLKQTDTNTEPAGTPIRLRIRLKGETTWINLPELHAHRERISPFRGLIKLRFQAASGGITRPDQDQSVPPWKYALYLTDTNNDELFDVDSYFQPVSGNNAVKVGSEQGIVVIYLDPATFTPGIYDVQIKRGYAYGVNDFVVSTYLHSGGIPYFFSHTAGSSPVSIRQEQSKVLTVMNILSMSNVWNEYPLTSKGLTLLAVRAKNISINSLSILATGYFYVWDGTDWNTFEPSKNPAAIFRGLATGLQTIDPPFQTAQLDDTCLEDWYDFCGDERSKAVAFDGSTDYYTRGAGLTGAADSKLLSFSLWVRLDATSASGGRIIASTSTLAGGAANARFRIAFSGSAGNISIIGTNSAGTTILAITSAELLLGVWSHVLVSVDMSDTAKRHIYVNDISALSSVTTYTNDTIDFTQADWGIGAYPDGTVPLTAALSDVWFMPGTYIDFSVEANRRKFISKYGRPVPLGATGSTPTGSQPILYLSKDDTAFTTNEGSGGDFTENGTPLADVIRDSAGQLNREFNAYISGAQSVGDLLRIGAGCGLASPRMSEQLGVVVDNDRSSESPVAVFTQRNAKELSIRRSFPRLPDLLRVTFNNEDNEYQPEEIFSYRNPLTPTIVESANYVGLTRLEAVRERLDQEWRNLLRRQAIYTLTTDAQNLYCVKGSLISLSYDTLSRKFDAARVVKADMSSGTIVGLQADCELRLDLIGDAHGQVFDGSNDYYTRGATLTGAADAKTFTVSFWFRRNSAVTYESILNAVTTVGGSTVRFEVDFFNDRVNLYAVNSSGTNILDISSETIQDSDWHHIVASIDLANAPGSLMYMDDELNTIVSTTFVNDTIDFTVADWGIGALPDGTSKLTAAIADLWFNDGTYIDLSVEANRRKFITARGRPAYLGSDGSGPTGSQPILYLSGEFTANLGDGGNFTAIGDTTPVDVFHDTVDFPAGVIVQYEDGSTVTAQIDETAQTSTITFTTPLSLPSYLTNLGAWATSTSYALGDAVTNDGESYEAMAAHTSGATTEPGTGTTWRTVWKPLLEDCLLSSGPLSTIEKRMIISAIKPKDEFTAELTLIDEAAPMLVTGGGDDIYAPDGQGITTAY